MIHKLENTIEGTGEVKGFLFIKKFENDKGYVYEVTSEGHIHYESFLKKTAPVCIDFNKRIYSETDIKEKYPKSKDFGVWAWTTKTLERGIEKLN